MTAKQISIYIIGYNHRQCLCISFHFVVVRFGMCILFRKWSLGYNMYFGAKHSICFWSNRQITNIDGGHGISLQPLASQHTTI